MDGDGWALASSGAQRAIAATSGISRCTDGWERVSLESSLHLVESQAVMAIAVAGQQIGAVAKRSGVSVKTIRFYCEHGLLQPVSRSEGRYRLFAESVYEELSLIRTLRGMEIPLGTIRTVLDARRSGICTCENLQATIRNKAGEIHQRIEDLKALKTELERMLGSWESCGGVSPAGGKAPEQNSEPEG